MYVQQDLNPYISNLRFISAFAEEYHCQFDGYYYWKDEEKKCEEYLRKRSAYVIWGVILTIVGLILAIYGIVAFYNFLVDSYDDLLLPLKVMSACIGIPMAPIGVGIFIRGTVLSAKKEKERKKAIKNKEFFKSEIDRYKTSSVFAQQRDIYVSYFPDCKARKSDIDYLILVMQTGRAATFKEALILLDKKKYDDEMKEIAEKTMEYARRAANKPSGSTVNNYYYNR